MRTRRHLGTVGEAAHRDRQLLRQTEMRDAIEIRKAAKPKRLWDRRYEPFLDPRVQQWGRPPAACIFFLKCGKERRQRPEARSVDRERTPPHRMPEHRSDVPKQRAAI